MTRQVGECAYSSRVRTPRPKDIDIIQPVPGDSLQFVGQAAADQLDVVLGIDFGTSSTRAVIQLPYDIEKPTFAVPLGGGVRDLGQYLLPARLFIDKQRVCSLTFNQRASMFVELKTNLMVRPHAQIHAVSGPSCAFPATVIATAYLALALREARTWFISRKGSSYGQSALGWMVNFGLPAAIDDNSNRRKSFDLVIRAAWIASIRPGKISVCHCEKSISDVYHGRHDGEREHVDIELVPEVVAQAIGYAKSRFRNEGLHLLVDVGASTLDVCSFNLFTKDFEDQWPILTANVKPLGARQFHYRRLQAAQDLRNRRILRQFDISDPLAAIPDPVVDETEICDVERSFAEECRSVIAGAIFDLKEHRYPGSPVWSDSLPVIVCGGAATLDIYQRAINDTSRWMRRSYRSSKGLTVVRIPKPNGLEANLQSEAFHRISVAYGLSYPTFDMGEYTRPTEIENIGGEYRSDDDASSSMGARGLGGGDKEVT